ncbi:flagellar basal body P-ring formation chaperone FlgA [Candidatus Bodocaedibacter vickermanii]|uniref:Flagella basal body P-ring formation protein FlgA n=1 Tax=Candidatus Bodocaedibacter vickermanii TaxID=2741701 RepID=A0A7L9RU10_9PROT|nr:flagella basal body P-ring formation protein FlgA [Candidatus Paracaedibacteraceae bacterium 'Lake Konstanz']
MKQTISFLVVIFFSLTSAHAVKVELKDSHEVYKEFLMLSDFFGGIDPAKDQDILEAPNKGESKHYAHDWVRQLAENFGLSWAPSHYKGITLSRHDGLSTKVNAQDVVREYLTQHHPEKISGGIDVSIEASSQYLLLKGATEPKLTNFSWMGDQKFLVTFDVGGHEKKIKGCLSTMVLIPVLNKQLEVGSIIEKEDLEFKDFPSNKVTKNMIQDEKELIGKTLRRKSAKVGDMLSVHDIISPIIIKRGDLVTMKVETPTVVISTRGKAQGNAAIGQSVQVMNLESKRLIEGVVKDSQTIIIPVVGH